MMCISIVVHQFNRMHPWSTWEGMLPGGCSPGKRCHTFWDVNIVLLRVVSGKVHCVPENTLSWQKVSHLLGREYRVVTRSFGQSALCS